MRKFNAFTLAEGVTHVATPNNKQSFGFTLAEVLITLGIIGVVAAMTMPTLMNSTQGAQYKAAYKKALSALGQAVTLNVALDGGSFADTEVASATTANTDGKLNTADLLRSRMNVVKSDTTAGYAFPDVKAEVCQDANKHVIPCADGTTATSVALNLDMFLFLNDGIVFAFDKADTGCTNVASQSGGKDKVCYGAIDVNGQKGPNKVVKCNSGTGATATAKDTFDATTGVKTEATSCEVGNPTDVYPVFFYDQTVTPATNAAKAVLYGK